MDEPRRRFRVTLLDTFFGDNTFEFCRAVADFAEPRRHWRLLGSIGFSPFSPWAAVPWGEVDGFMGIDMNAAMADLAVRKRVATVSVAPRDPDTPLAHVTSDYRAVGAMGAEHLLARGYAHYAYIGENSWPSAQQREGFTQTLRAAGRTCLTTTLTARTTAAITKQVRGWLAEFPKPIAIMTAMDYLARYTVNVAVDMGLRVPGDVGVLGVNDNRWASIMAAVPISSIRLDERRLGQVAARTLETLMRGGAAPPLQIVPPLQVVTRRSTDTILSQDPLVAAALDFIRDHAEEGIDVEDVLVEVQCSRSTLEKRMKGELGYTVHTAITRARVEKVKKMLVGTEVSTEQIAHHCGFEHQARLFETFKRVTGMTPAAYRRSMRNAGPADAM